MLARLHSVTLEGIEGIICEVEVDVARGGFEKSIIVGLPDAAVRPCNRHQPDRAVKGRNVETDLRATLRYRLPCGRVQSRL